MKRLILSFFLTSLFTLSAFAQIAGEDSTSNAVSQRVKKQVDEAKKKFNAQLYIPSALRIGTDLIGLGASALGNSRKRYEFNADIDINRFYIVGDYGTETYNIAEESYDYSHNGYFFRIGLDADFLKFDEDYNTLLFGFRYGEANFNEQLNINQNDTIFGTINKELKNTSVRSRWFELTAGLRVRMVGNFYTGFTFRIQLSNSVFDSDGTEFTPYDVPGFGLNQYNNRWTFNYYLVYRLAWRDKKLPIRLPK